MRKLLVLLLAICAMVWFPAASPWEGAASVAPAGELPSTGFFVATNSFPRNTVVDITNIETGKSTRAIVAKTLNSPGLLAIVSNEAAQLIGMRVGSVSRIQMVQPTDPIAYLRFTESVNSNAPNYDSGAVITEETLVAEVYSDDTYRPQIIETPEPVQPESAAQRVAQPAQQAAQQESTQNRITGPGYFMEPEWGGNDRLNIVDLPGYETDPRDPVYIAPPAEVVQAPEELPAEETEPYNDIVFIPREALEVPPVEKEETPEELPAQQVAEEPVYIAGKREVVKDVSERYNEKPPAPVVKDVPDFRAEKEANGVDKEANIFLVEEQKKEVIKEPYDYLAEKPRGEVIKEIFDREEFVAEVVPPEEQPVYQYNLTPTEEQPPQQTVYGIDPSDIIPVIAEKEPEPPVQQECVPERSDAKFSVRTISSLDRGQYYVQVAALPADSVESTVRQIDQRFNPVVLVDKDNWYRVLIGPLNQGESAAVLARFKSIGYNDAFVRRGN